MTHSTLQKKMLAAWQKIEKDKRSPRFLAVVGNFIRIGALQSTDIPPSHSPITIDDALWAGEIEPRILEVLPAVILKCPRALYQPVAYRMPDDLMTTLSGIRSGNPPTRFRGIHSDRYLPWVEKLGRTGKLPTRLSTFRLSPSDKKILNTLSQKWACPESEVIRRLLRAHG